MAEDDDERFLLKEIGIEEHHVLYYLEPHCNEVEGAYQQYFLIEKNDLCMLGCAQSPLVINIDLVMPRPGPARPRLSSGLDRFFGSKISKEGWMYFCWYYLLLN
jgi:hypothetical protein